MLEGFTGLAFFAGRVESLGYADVYASHSTRPLPAIHRRAFCDENGAWLSPQEIAARQRAMLSDFDGRAYRRAYGNLPDVYERHFALVLSEWAASRHGRFVPVYALLEERGLVEEWMKENGQGLGGWGCVPETYGSKSRGESYV